MNISDLVKLANSYDTETGGLSALKQLKKPASASDFMKSSELKNAENFEDYLVEELDIDPEEFDEDLEKLGKELAEEKVKEKAEEGAEEAPEDEVAAEEEVTPEEEAMQKLFELLFSSEVIRDFIDSDESGDISEEEMKEFIMSLMEADGDVESLTVKDIALKLQEFSEKINGVTEASQHIIPSSSLFPTSPSSGGYSGGGSVSGGSSPGGYSGGSYSPAVTSSSISNADLQNLANTINGNDLESLEEQKATLEGEIQEHKENITKANNGSSEAMQAAKSAMEDAKVAMDDAIDKDEKIDEELKEQIKQVEADLTENAQAITGKNAEITNTESAITAAEASITSLEGMLNALPAPTGKEGDEESDAKLKARKEELQAQIDAKKAELDELKTNLETLKGELEELETAKTDLETEKDKLLGEQMEKVSPETKAAIEEYEAARDNIETVRAEELAAEQAELDTKVQELSEVEAKIEEAKNNKAQASFDFDFSENMTEAQRAELEKFRNNFTQNEARYQAVAEKTGVPAELIAALHWRESGGNFGTYMHNGDPLGTPTTHYPAGKLFYDWESSAVDALSSSGYGKVDSNDINTYYDYAERYNGLGYRKKGVASPYVWSGTGNYTGGKYVADGVYSASAYDKQLGVAVMLKSVLG